MRTIEVFVNTRTEFAGKPAPTSIARFDKRLRLPAARGLIHAPSSSLGARLRASRPNPTRCK